MRAVMPAIFLVIGGLLLGYALFVNLALDAIGALPYGERLVLCFLLIAPPAFLMGFPMPTAMTTLGRLGKDHLFIWAWGVNGSFLGDRRGGRAGDRDQLRTRRGHRDRRLRLSLGAARVFWRDRCG